MVTAENHSEMVGSTGSDDVGAFHPDRGLDDEPCPDRSVGVLLIRAWIEPHGKPVVRARMLTTEDHSPTPTTWAMAAGTEAIGDEVVRWLHELQQRARGTTSSDQPGSG